MEMSAIPLAFVSTGGKLKPIPRGKQPHGAGGTIIKQEHENGLTHGDVHLN